MCLFEMIVALLQDMNWEFFNNSKISTRTRLLLGLMVSGASLTFTVCFFYIVITDNNIFAKVFCFIMGTLSSTFTFILIRKILKNNNGSQT